MGRGSPENESPRPPQAAPGAPSKPPPPPPLSQPLLGPRTTKQTPHENRQLLALGQPKKTGEAASPDASDAGTMPPKRVVDTAKTGEARGKGAAELAAERVALQEEKGEESSDDEFLMPGERRLKNRLKLEVPRQSWQMEVLEANRLGDVERLRVAFRRPGANVNLRTAEGAYGGFRYATWGTHSSYLGGNPSGESLLMLAARPDNAQYPNRREVLTMLIEEFDAERNYRNGNEKTARDLNPLLMDEVHPLKRWTVEDAHAWAESAGLKVKIEHTYDWLKIFDAYQLDGRGSWTSGRNKSSRTMWTSDWRT